jgi:hypothetical protein
MQKLNQAILAILFSFFASAAAANTLVITACTEQSVDFNWSVSDLDRAPYVTATDTGDATNTHQFILFALSAAVSVDLAQNWNGTDNRRVSLTLASTPPITATCP